MAKQFFKEMALDSSKMDMSDNAKYAILQAKDDLLCGKRENALEILTNLLAAVRENREAK